MAALVALRDRVRIHLRPSIAAGTSGCRWCLQHNRLRAWSGSLDYPCRMARTALAVIYSTRLVYSRSGKRAPDRMSQTSIVREKIQTQDCLRGTNWDINIMHVPRSSLCSFALRRCIRTTNCIDPGANHPLERCTLTLLSTTIFITRAFGNSSPHAWLLSDAS